jgi:hypothetical protein
MPLALVYIFVPEIGSQVTARAGLKLRILLSLLPE